MSQVHLYSVHYSSGCQGGSDGPQEAKTSLPAPQGTEETGWRQPALGGGTLTGQQLQ